MCVRTQEGEQHCLNAACQTNASTQNDTLQKVLRMTRGADSSIHAQKGDAPWSPHSLKPFAEASAKRRRGMDDSNEKIQHE